MSATIIKAALSLVVIGGSGAYLLTDTLQDPDALTYFHNADVVIAMAGQFEGQRIRMGGFVEDGSILKKKGTLEYQFEVRPVEEMIKHPEARGKIIKVMYTGVVPDTFKDDANVIVGGVLQPDGTFHATEVIAKCPSKYEAEEKNSGTY